MVEEDAVGLEAGGHGGAPGGGVQGEEGAGGLGAQAGQRLLHLTLHAPQLLRRHLGGEGQGREGAVEAHLEVRRSGGAEERRSGVREEGRRVRTSSQATRWRGPASSREVSEASPLQSIGGWTTKLAFGNLGEFL